MTTDQASVSKSLAFQGEMNVYNAAANFNRLREHIASRLPLYLDLSKVAEIDSSGLQLLLFAHSEAESQGLDFRITALSETVDEVLSLLFLKRTLGLPTAPQPETRA